jgi:hypothetical protein
MKTCHLRENVMELEIMLSKISQRIVYLIHMYMYNLIYIYMCNLYLIYMHICMCIYYIFIYYIHICNIIYMYIYMNYMNIQGELLVEDTNWRGRGKKRVIEINLIKVHPMHVQKHHNKTPLYN